MPGPGPGRTPSLPRRVPSDLVRPNALEFVMLPPEAGEAAEGIPAMTVAKPRLSESLGRFLERCAAARPASLEWGEETIGLAALLEESRRAARGLADLGIGKGDRVALWLPNTPAWLAL